MRIGLLIAGHLRSIKENTSKIKENIIQCHEVDVYIHVTNDVDDKYRNESIDINFVHREFNPKILLVTNNLEFTNDKKLNHLLNQNYKLYRIHDEMTKYAKIQHINYDVVMKIRPDTHLQSKIDFDISNNIVYIPQDSKIDQTKLVHASDPSICDIIAYGDPHIMSKYFRFYEELPDLYKQFGPINETLLYHYLTQSAIPYEMVNIDYIVILSLCNTIGITGDSGSGKTTVSNIIKNMIDDSFVLECDRYHKWERTDKKWSEFTHLNPESNLLMKMEQDIFNLKIGNDIYQVDYDHSSGKFTEKTRIESKDTIIVCGLHSLYMPNNIIKLKIYMDTDENLKIPWKIKRDMQKRGYSLDKIMNQIEARKHDFIKYIYPQRELADIIIRMYTNIPYESNHPSPPVFLNIGFANQFNLTSIIAHFQIYDIHPGEKHTFLEFGEISPCDLKNIIQFIVISV